MKIIFLLIALTIGNSNCLHSFESDYWHVHSYYVSAFGGANFLDIQKQHTPLHLSFDTGYIGAFAIGYDFNPFRVEGEVSYRWNKISQFKEHHSHSSPPINAHIDSLFWMVNGYYDYHWSHWFAPYIGLGIGYGNVMGHLVTHQEINRKLRSSGYAMQALGGFKTMIWGNTDLSIEYRYHYARAHILNQSIGLKLSYSY